MGLDALQIPDYAKDLRLNLGRVISNAALDPAGAWGAALAAALVSRNRQVIAAVLDDAREHLDEALLEGVRSAAAIMKINNVRYKFLDHISDDEVKRQPAKLRMNAMMSHGGVDKALFETWSLAASVVNACGTCVDAHAAELRKHDLTAQHIVDVARIAAVVKAVADTLTFDEMMG